MHTNDNGRAVARSLATRRLRKLTIGTTLLGVAATGMLSGAAALTYDGSTSSTAAAAVVSSVSVDDGTTSTATAGATTVPLVTIVQGAAHVSTGGS